MIIYGQIKPTHKHRGTRVQKYEVNRLSINVKRRNIISVYLVHLETPHKITQFTAINPHIHKITQITAINRLTSYPPKAYISVNITILNFHFGPQFYPRTAEGI